MLNPSIIDLLDGIADSLSATVADRLPPGPERTQVTAACHMLRRIARALGDLVPTTVADTRALADVVTAMIRAGELELTPATVDALTMAGGLPADPLPSLGELAAANTALRTALASVAARDNLSDEADAVVRSALADLVAREASLGLSPWER